MKHLISTELRRYASCVVTCGAAIMMSINAMAGPNVVKKGSTLEITGDFSPGDDNITIRELAVPGSYEIVASDLHVDGVPDVDDIAEFTGIKNIKADLGSGFDSFALIGENSIPDSRLSGNFSVESNGGLTINDLDGGFDIKGKLSVDQTGNFVLDIFFDDFSNGPSTIGSLDINGGSDNSNIYLTGANVVKNVDFDPGPGSGSNTFSMNTGASIGGNLKIADGEINIVDFNSRARIKGSVTVDASANDPAEPLNLNMFDAVIGKGMKITGSDADDYITIVSSTFGRTGNAVNLNLAGGSNSLILNETLANGNVLISKPSQMSMVDLFNTRVRGKLMVDSSAGTNVMSVNLYDSTIDKDVTVLGGDDDDWVIFENVSVGSGRSVLLDLGDSNNFVTVNNSTLKGHLTSKPGGKLASVNLDRTSIGGFLRLESAASDALDDPLIVNLTSSQVARGVFANGGEASDSVNIDRSRIGGSKSVDVDLGPGDNELYIQSEAHVEGDVLTKPSGELVRFESNDAHLGKNVTVNASANPATGIVVILNRPDILGKLTVNGSDLVDIMDINEGMVLGTTTVEMGGDNDIVNLNASSPFNNPSQFVGNVKIDMGDGNADALLVGSAGAGQTGTSKFFGKASFDGGPGGLDDLVNEEFGYFAKGFSEKNFEGP